MRRLGWGLAALWLAAALLVLPLLAVQRGGVGGAPQASPAASPAPAATALPARTTPYRAVWVSYLEWQQVDFSSAASFARDAGAMLDDIAALGATVVLAQVRPFGDALYPSDYFPFSHLCTGTQGQDPGFDPLALLVQAAHDRGLELEAWVNPYRLQAGGVPALCAASPAVQHPGWVRATAEGLYLNPASAEVRQYIADGVAELCENYALDGIHFDDYFYPTTDPAFDEADYAAAGSSLPLDDWRRQNVNALMALCHDVTQRCGVRFGAAPLADPDLCYSGQYSDAALWLAQGGYVDYLMPQLYWGLDYTRGRRQPPTAWARRLRAGPRCPGPRAWRCTAGWAPTASGTATASDTPGEWTTGRALASQWAALEALGFEGGGLYRYASLWRNPAREALTAQERDALAALWQA